MNEGTALGMSVGVSVGAQVGNAVGSEVGEFAAKTKQIGVRRLSRGGEQCRRALAHRTCNRHDVLGAAVGTNVGAAVGFAVGANVGAAVGGLISVLEVVSCISAGK